MSKISKVAVTVALGDYYGNNSTGYTALPFVYKNVTDLQSFLNDKTWETPVTVLDIAASKANILAKLQEVIANLGSGGWLVLYYTGHGARFDAGTGLANLKTYCVTFTPDLRYNYFPGVLSFLTEDDYAVIVKAFGDSIPNGHLITILDCCNAYGLIDTFAQQEDFHTVIAATSADSSAYYNTNSAFFSAFSQVWGSTFDQLQDAINQKMSAIGAPNTCIVKLAKNFQQATF